MRRLGSIVADFFFGSRRCPHGRRLDDHGIVYVNCYGCSKDMNDEYQAKLAAIEQSKRETRIQETMEALRRFHQATLKD